MSYVDISIPVEELCDFLSIDRLIHLNEYDRFKHSILIIDFVIGQLSRFKIEISRNINAEHYPVFKLLKVFVVDGSVLHARVVLNLSCGWFCTVTYFFIWRGLPASLFWLAIQFLRENLVRAQLLLFLGWRYYFANLYVLGNSNEHSSSHVSIKSGIMTLFIVLVLIESKHRIWVFVKLNDDVVAQFLITLAFVEEML